MEPEHLASGSVFFRGVRSLSKTVRWEDSDVRDFITLQNWRRLPTIAVTCRYYFVTLLSPLWHPATTFHSFSSLPVFKIIENSSPLVSLVSLLVYSWTFTGCIAVPSPWCSCLKEPQLKTCQIEKYLVISLFSWQRHMTSYWQEPRLQPWARWSSVIITPCHKIPAFHRQMDSEKSTAPCIHWYSDRKQFYMSEMTGC